jgi:hypothetical protein
VLNVLVNETSGVKGASHRLGKGTRADSADTQPNSSQNPPIRVAKETVNKEKEAASYTNEARPKKDLTSLFTNWLETVAY